MIEHGGSQSQYFQCLAKTFHAMSYQVSVVDTMKFSIFDAFTRFVPQIFICRADRVTRGTEKCLLAFPRDNSARSCKFVCFEEDDLHQFWGIIDRKRIDLSCSIYSGAGFQVLPGLDHTTLSKGAIENKYKCDYAFIGEWKDWMAPYVKYLIDHDKNVKIYSYTACNLPQNVGALNQNDITNAMVSADHVIDLDLISDKFFQILYCGVGRSSYFLADPNKKKIFPDLQYFSNVEEFVNLVENPPIFENPPQYGRDVYLFHTNQSRALSILNALA